MIVQKTLSVFCVTALYLCFPVIYFLFSGGIYTYCYGSSATWTESACSLIRNDVFILSNFTLLLLLTISSCYVVLFRLNKLQVVSKFLLHIGIPLFIINVLGFFAPLRFCLGFLGCNTIYYWPVTVSYTTGLLIGFYLYVLFGKTREVSEWTFGYSIKLTSIITIFGGLFAWGTVAAVNYVVVSESAFLQNLFAEDDQLQVPEQIIIPLEDTEEIKNYRVGRGFGMSLVVDSENIAVKLTDEDNEVIAPINLRQISDSDLGGNWISDSREFYVEDGVTYSKMPSSYPFTYHMYASGSDLVDVSILSGSSEFDAINAIPVYDGTRLDLNLYQDEARKVNIYKIQYDFNNDGYIDGEISWNEQHCLLSLAVLRSFLDQQIISGIDKLRIYEVLNSLENRFRGDDVSYKSFISYLDNINNIHVVSEYKINNQLSELYFVCEEPLNE